MQNVKNISREMHCTQSWLKTVSGERTKTVYLAEADCENEFFGSSLWEGVLWQHFVRMGIVAAVCEKGFCGSSLWKLILWYQITGRDFVAADYRNELCGSRLWESILSIFQLRVWRRWSFSLSWHRFRNLSNTACNNTDAKEGALITLKIVSKVLFC
jgi:hypothetical protein